MRQQRCRARSFTRTQSMTAAATAVASSFSSSSSSTSSCGVTEDPRRKRPSGEGEPTLKVTLQRPPTHERTADGFVSFNGGSEAGATNEQTDDRAAKLPSLFLCAAFRRFSRLLA